MRKTGELLKQKRESSNLSISEVALATKINPKILSAIENGEDGHLPAKTFLKGFVRTYALFLKLDSDEIMRTFLEETGERPQESMRNVDNTPTKKRTRVDEESSSLRAVAVVLIVALIGAIIGLRELIDKYQREKVVVDQSEIKVSPLEPTKPEEPKPVTAAVDTPAKVEAAAPPAPQVTPPLLPPAEAPTAEQAAPKPVQDKPETVVKVEAKPEPPKPEPPKPEPPKPEVVAKVEPVKPPEPAKPVEQVKAPEAAKVEAKPEPTPASAPAEKPAAAAKRTEVILEALDNVSVKVQIKGQTRLVSLGPTQVHTIHADGPLVLDVSDGGAVNLILNGRDRGPAGELGKPKQIKVP